MLKHNFTEKHKFLYGFASWQGYLDHNTQIAFLSKLKLICCGHLKEAEPIKNKDVSRTAPASPGLLKRHIEHT